MKLKKVAKLEKKNLNDVFYAIIPEIAGVKSINSGFFNYYIVIDIDQLENDIAISKTTPKEGPRNLFSCLENLKQAKKDYKKCQGIKKFTTWLAIQKLQNKKVKKHDLIPLMIIIMKREKGISEDEFFQQLEEYVQENFVE